MPASNARAQSSFSSSFSSSQSCQGKYRSRPVCKAIAGGIEARNDDCDSARVRPYSKRASSPRALMTLPLKEILAVLSAGCLTRLARSFTPKHLATSPSKTSVKCWMLLITGCTSRAMSAGKSDGRMYCSPTSSLTDVLTTQIFKRAISSADGAGLVMGIVAGGRSYVRRPNRWRLRSE